MCSTSHLAATTLHHLHIPFSFITVCSHFPYNILDEFNQGLPPTSLTSPTRSRSTCLVTTLYCLHIIPCHYNVLEIITTPISQTSWIQDLALTSLTRSWLTWLVETGSCQITIIVMGDICSGIYQVCSALFVHLLSQTSWIQDLALTSLTRSRLTWHVETGSCQITIIVMGDICSGIYQVCSALFVHLHFIVW